MRSMIRSGATLFGLLTVMSLAACGSDMPTTPVRAVTVTESASPPPTTRAPSDVEPLQPITGQDGPAPTGTANARATGCTPGAGPVAAAQRDRQRIPAPRAENGWETTGSGGTWCGALSWVTLRSADGTGPVRPHQLLIYEDGTFLGTGIRCNIRWGQEVVSTTTDAVTVRYRYPDPTDPAQMNTQNPLGSATTTYHWKRITDVMETSTPAVATKNNC